MTSAPFTSDARSSDGHPDVAEISALNEELLPPDRSSALHAHLANCRLCANVRASLDEIRDTLATLPGPSRMPADVAGRIDAALAAEALLASPQGDASLVSRETSDDPSDDDRYAGIAVEPTPHGTAVVSHETSGARRPDRPAGRPGTSSSGPGRHRPQHRARRWRPVLLASAGAVVALGLGGLVLQTVNGSTPPTAGSGTDAHERTIAGNALEKHVHGLLAKRDAESKEGSSGSSSGDPTDQESPEDEPLAGSTRSVPSCVRAGLDRGEKPLAVDKDVPYKGGTAYLVVLPHQDDPKRVDAYVVDPSCVTDKGSGPGELLTRHTYTRH